MEGKVYRAAWEGSWEELSSCDGWYDQVTVTGNTVVHVHLERPIEDQGINNAQSEEFLKKVLDHKVQTTGTRSLLLHENGNREIPLVIAARSGRANAVLELLERASAVDMEEVRRMLTRANKRKDTALHEAARAGYSRIVELLVEADPTCPYEANDAQETPLYLAAESGSYACVTAILDTCAPSAVSYGHKGPRGRTPLHVLVQWGLPAQTHKLLNKDESLLTLEDDEGLTPVHHAAAENKIEQLRVLLSHDVNTNESVAYTRDKLGRTPLHVATLHLSWDAMEELIACRPDCIEIVDNQQRNVLHYAASWACITRLNCFLQLGSNLNKLMNGQDLAGNTPLHLIAASAEYMTCTCIARMPAFIRHHQRYANLFNNQHHTPAEIVKSLHSPHNFWPYLADLITLSGWMKPLAPICGRFARKSKVGSARARATTREKLKLAADRLKGAAQGHLVVAALVATVSFTAGFTLPGGFNQNPGSDMGTAVMIKKAAFQAFLVSDAMALAFSSIAVLMYFHGIWFRGPLVVVACLNWANRLCLFSIGAMMVAFVTGVYVVIPHSLPLQIVLFVVCAFFFATYVPRIVSTFYIELSGIDLCCLSPRIHPQKKAGKPNTFHFKRVAH